MRYRAILSTALLLMGFSVLAQAPVTRSFEVADTFDRSALKFVIEAVVNVDPMANVTYSDDMRIVQVKSAQLSEAEMRTAIESTGLQLREGLADLSTYLPAADPNAPPVYVVSGNEVEDQERYRTAVDTWNAAHPEQPYSVTPIHTTDR